MVFSVMLRNGSSGECRLGLAMTGCDSMQRDVASVTYGAEPVLATNGLVVCVRTGTSARCCLALLEAGFAVQVRNYGWPKKPAAAVEEADPEDIDLD